MASVRPADPASRSCRLPRSPAPRQKTRSLSQALPGLPSLPAATDSRLRRSEEAASKNHRLDRDRPQLLDSPQRPAVRSSGRLGRSDSGPKQLQPRSPDPQGRPEQTQTRRQPPAEEASQMLVPVFSSSCQDFCLQGHYDDASAKPQGRPAPQPEKYRYTVNHIDDTENYRFNEWTSPYFKPTPTYNYFASSHEHLEPAEAGNYRFRKAHTQHLHDKWVAK